MPSVRPLRPLMLAIALVHAIAAASPAVAEVYRYKDERGNWVYADRPPAAGQSAESLPVKVRGSLAADRGRTAFIERRGGPGCGQRVPLRGRVRHQGQGRRWAGADRQGGRARAVAAGAARGADRARHGKDHIRLWLRHRQAGRCPRSGPSIPRPIRARAVVRGVAGSAARHHAPGCREPQCDRHRDARRHGGARRARGPRHQRRAPLLPRRARHRHQRRSELRAGAARRWHDRDLCPPADGHDPRAAGPASRARRVHRKFRQYRVLERAAPALRRRAQRRVPQRVGAGRVRRPGRNERSASHRIVR